MKYSKETTVFVIIIVLLSTVLIAGGMWSVNNQKKKDEQALKLLQADLSRLESRYNAEMGNTQEGTFPYSSIDSVRSELNRIADMIRNDRRLIANKPEEVIARMEAFQSNKMQYESTLNGIIAERDRNTGGFIAGMKNELDKAKADLDAALKKNRSLSAQLNNSIKAFRGAQKELEALKAEKARFDDMGRDMADLRIQLDSLISERNQLRSLLADAEALIGQQEARIRELESRAEKSVDRRVFNFKATYEVRRGVNAVLDESDRHRTGQVDQITFNFTVGDQLFDSNDERVLFLTMYRNNQPYRYIKVPVRVSGAQVNQTMNIRPKLESGSYFFRLTYKEQPVMPDYKFRIR